MTIDDLIPPKPSTYALGKRMGRLKDIKEYLRSRGMREPRNEEQADAFLRSPAVFPYTDPLIWANHRRYWMARRIYRKADNTIRHNDRSFQQTLCEEIERYKERKTGNKRAHRPTLLVGLDDAAYFGPKQGHAVRIIMALNTAESFDYAFRDYLSGAPPEDRLQAEHERLREQYPLLNVKIDTGAERVTRKGHRVLGRPI
jgi:hypothetical protein